MANNGEVRGVQLRGIEPAEEKQVADYWQKMPYGRFEDLKAGEFDIILARIWPTRWAWKKAAK